MKSPKSSYDVASPLTSDAWFPSRPGCSLYRRGPAQWTSWNGNAWRHAARKFHAEDYLDGFTGSRNRLVHSSMLVSRAKVVCHGHPVVLGACTLIDQVNPRAWLCSRRTVGPHLCSLARHLAVCTFQHDSMRLQFSFGGF